MTMESLTSRNVTLAVLPDWPACDHRVLIDDPQLLDRAFCKHQRVRTPRQLVTLDVCDTCLLRLTNSPPPPPPRQEQGSGCCGSGKKPTLARKGWNVAVAVARFLADGARTLSGDDYRARLEICETCDQRRDSTCTACGCSIRLKARGRAFECPLGKWPGVDAG